MTASPDEQTEREPPAPDDGAAEAGTPTSDDPAQTSFLDDRGVGAAGAAGGSGAAGETAAAGPGPAASGAGASPEEPAPPEPAGGPAAPAGVPGPAEPAADGGAGYRVLARKYRPRTLDEVIGQEVLVRTLRNAFASGRIAQAFILTGVRGVGKTTAARLIAKCLNATGGPTADFDVADPQCVAIAEDRHIDVMELDAASRTGVADMREVLDGVRYRPVEARYKVYIFDEVHMLSQNAFNALLKTLEEPPDHVKFIFATTEVRKVPVTVLSRCQRFDLRRLDPQELGAHLGRIAGLEGFTVEDGAVRLLAHAAAGSVRDGLSLLDQAMALVADGAVTEAQVHAMLGLADSGRSLDLFDMLMRGDVAAALDQLRGMYDLGTSPESAIQDLLDLTHWLTRLSFVPDADDGPPAAAAQTERCRDMAARLRMPELTRTWQLLLRGLAEVQDASSPIRAAEMVLVRLCHAAGLPPPGDLVRRLQADGAVPPPPPAAPDPAAGGAPPSPAARAAGVAHPLPAPAPGGAAPVAQPQDFAAVVALFEERRELALASHLRHNVGIVACHAGRLELRLRAEAPRDLPNRVLERLRSWCGAHWQVLVAGAGDAVAPALAEQERAAEAARRRTLAGHPLVRRVMETFPGATIETVRPLVPASAGDAAATTGDDAP